MQNKDAISSVSRDENIDSLKGFLIICIVLGHYSLRYFFWGENSSEPLLRFSEFLQGIIPVYYFHVPLFFAVSVFYIDRFDFAFFKKRAIAIVLPFVLWLTQASFIYAPIADLHKITENLDVILWGDWMHIRSPLWFLPALFSVTICFAMGKELMLRSERRIIRMPLIIAFFALWIWMFFSWKTISTLHVAGKIPWGIDLAFYLLPYLWLLNMVYVNRWTIQRWSKITKYLSTLIPMTLGWYLVFRYEPVKILEYHHQIDLAQYSVPNTVLGFTGFCLLSSSILLLFLVMPMIKILAWIGKYTFVIFVMHYYLISAYSKIFKTLQVKMNFLTSSIWVFIFSGVGFAFAIIAPILWSKLLMKFSLNFKYFGMQR